MWTLAHILYPPPESYWSELVHRPICDFFVKKDPSKTIGQQDDRKQRLLLDPRNHFKTTMDIVDMVQWILCFPDIRILIASGTRDNAIKMLRAVKSHFQYNQGLRFFFPELCPQAHKTEDFGTQDSLPAPPALSDTFGSQLVLLPHQTVPLRECTMMCSSSTT